MRVRVQTNAKFAFEFGDLHDESSDWPVFAVVSAVKRSAASPIWPLIAHDHLSIALNGALRLAGFSGCVGREAVNIPQE